MDKDKIRALVKEKKYDEVFREFGIKAYKKYVPSKYRRQDLAKLKKERRYEDIFNKYGQKEYNKILIKAMYEEIKEEKGGFKASLWRIARKIGLFGVTAAYTVSLPFATFTTLGATMTKVDAEKNKETYEKEIHEYVEKIGDYAEHVKGMGLTDIQIFMKVMDNMWKGIKGYGTPQKDLTGYLGLDLADEEGRGTCRNMASDVAEKLNKINPKYKARTMAVLMRTDSFYQIANIKRNIIETDSTVAEGVEKEEETDELISNIGNMLKSAVENTLGNHMVTLVDIPEENLTLVLDPTNPGIGVYMNGIIVMLNDAEGERVVYVAKEYSQAVLVKGGFDGILETIQGYLNSFGKSKLTFDEMVDKYGLRSQNDALEYTRVMEEILKASEGKTKEEEFRESIHVDLIEEQSTESNNESKEPISQELDDERN